MRRWPELGLFAAASAFYLAFVGRSGFQVDGRRFFALHDDAMISMRYAQNLAAGDGLTWSAGERVEGYSNFLWTLWMALVHLLPIHQSKTSLAIMLTGAASLVAIMLVVRAICDHLAPERRLLGFLAMALTGLFYPLAFWSLRGMEVGLATLLIALMVLLALRLEKAPTVRELGLLAAVMAMAVLTRDDLLLPCVIVGAYVVWTAPPAARRRALAIVGGTVLVAVAGHLAFRLAYYGNALPNTYYLKLGDIPLVDRLERGAIALSYTWLFTLYVPMLLAGAYLVARGRSLPRPALLLVALVVAQSAYSLYVGGDAWEDTRFANRYIASAAPLLMVLAVLGIGELTSPRGRRLVPWVAAAFAATAIVISHDWLPIGRLRIAPADGLRPPMALAAVAAVAVLALRRLRTTSAAAAIALAALALVQVDAVPVRDWARYNAQGLALDEYWTRAGLILREHTPPGTTIAVIGAGSTPYFAERPAIDLLGKNDPVIAHGPMKRRFWPGHNKWDWDYSIGRLRPDVVTLLWDATPAELCRIQAWGYRHVAPREIFVHRSARGVESGPIGRKTAAYFDNATWFVMPERCPPASGQGNQRSGRSG